VRGSFIFLDGPQALSPQALPASPLLEMTTGMVRTKGCGGLRPSFSAEVRWGAQFRAEFFNVLNHSNFTTPNPVVYSLGPTPKTPTVEAQASPTAGVVSATATTSRQIQFGLKLLF